MATALYATSFRSSAEASEAAETYRKMYEAEKRRWRRLRRPDRLRECEETIRLLQDWEGFAIGESCRLVLQGR